MPRECLYSRTVGPIALIRLCFNGRIHSAACSLQLSRYLVYKSLLSHCLAKGRSSLSTCVFDVTQERHMYRPICREAKNFSSVRHYRSWRGVIHYGDFNRSSARSRHGIASPTLQGKGNFRRVTFPALPKLLKVHNVLPKSYLPSLATFCKNMASHHEWIMEKTRKLYVRSIE